MSCPDCVASFVYEEKEVVFVFSELVFLNNVAAARFASHTQVVIPFQCVLSLSAS